MKGVDTKNRRNSENKDGVNTKKGRQKWGRYKKTGAGTKRNEVGTKKTGVDTKKRRPREKRGRYKKVKGFGEINRRKSEGFRYKKVKGADTKNRRNSENKDGVNTKKWRQKWGRYKKKGVDTRRHGVGTKIRALTQKRGGVDTKKRASVQKRRRCKLRASFPGQKSTD